MHAFSTQVRRQEASDHIRNLSHYYMYMLAVELMLCVYDGRNRETVLVAMSQ